ncbi:MAG: hypothetical protein FWG45_07845 [Oscillospiraceae bacterium]|nr:hypothetical protein [Oscillospiraceae bacterium]
MKNSRVSTLPEEQLYHNYVNDKLNKAEEWAANPDSKWHTHEEVINDLKSRYGI